MEDSTNDRKIQHLRVFGEDPDIDRNRNYFDEVLLIHRGLPELDFSEIDTSVNYLGKQLSFPLLISPMTGGDHSLIEKINRNLALAAEECQVAMAVGSQRVMFTHPESFESFNIRKYAPTVLLFGNLGGVQLNYGMSSIEACEAVERIGADALGFHVNPLQEVIQPGGDVNFSGVIKKIGEVNKVLNVPVILKEVGCGLSVQDIKLAHGYGIEYFDVAGSGGTSWSRIEHNRRTDPSNNLGLLFQDWGIPTPVALMNASKAVPDLNLIASGGLRNGVDMVKSMILGASLCGIASPFVQPAECSADKVVELIEALKKEFKVAMFLLGVSNVEDLLGNRALLLKP